MKKILVMIVAVSILLILIAYAHEEKIIEPGVTPDSFFWGLDKALDNLNLFLTFDPAKKARKGIEIARERLEEVKIMAEQNKLEAAVKVKDEQLKVLSKIKQSISKIKDANATKQIEEEIEIERELGEHEDEIEEVRSNLKINEMLDSLLGALENKTGEVKIEIKNKKGMTKITIKQKTGKSEKEIEEEIEDIEEELGLADTNKEEAAEEIEDAKEELMELDEELLEHELEGHVANETPITALMDSAKEKISNAEDAVKAGDFGEALGQANSAQQLIKNAEKILEKTVEAFEEDEEEHEI